MAKLTEQQQEQLKSLLEDVVHGEEYWASAEELAEYLLEIYFGILTFRN